MRSVIQCVCVGLLATLLLAVPAADADEIIQQGGLRVESDAKLSPSALPRDGLAPVAVSIGGEISTADGSTPPQLRSITIQINRHGHFDYAGLPTCPLSRIQPGSTVHALVSCRGSLVGQGHFAANSLVAGSPLPTQGRLLLFNGREHGRPVLFGHIYATQPFVSSSVIPFHMLQKPHGEFGTELSANLAAALGSRDYLTGIEMTLKRSFRVAGKPHSYLSAGCPAPKGFSSVAFPLARVSYAFAGGPTLSQVMTRNCEVRG